jgi:hypothetical protein
VRHLHEKARGQVDLLRLDALEDALVAVVGGLGDGGSGGVLRDHVGVLHSRLPAGAHAWKCSARTVKLVARLLEAEGARWALVGGHAIAAHGFVRFSEDVAILVDPSPDNAKRWIAALSRLPDGATRDLVGQEDIFEREGPYAVRVNDEFTVDVLPAACGHSWAELEPYTEQRTIDGVPIRLLGLDGLLKTKEGMLDKDRADAAVLRSAISALRRGPGER